MSIGFLLEANKGVIPQGRPATLPRQGFLDVTGAAFDSVLKNQLSTSQFHLEQSRVNRQRDRLGELTGSTWKEILGQEAGDFDARDQWILDKRKEDDRFSAVETTQEMRQSAQEEARRSARGFQDVVQNAGGFSAIAGSLVGGVAASMADPVIIGASAAGSALFGVGAAAPVIGKAAHVLRFLAIEGAIGAGTEVLIQPTIAQWQRTTGQEYGLGDALTAVAFAGVGSAVLGGVMDAAVRSNVLGLAAEAGSKGRSGSAALFEAIGSDPRVPEQLREPMKVMAEIANVKESNTAQIKTAHAEAAHAANVKAVFDAVSDRRSLATVKIQNAELFVPPRPVKRDAEELARISFRLEQLQKSVAESQKGAKYPVLNMIRSMGGVRVGSKLDAELRHMGINPKTMPGLFKKNKGIGEIDNIDARTIEERTGIQGIPRDLNDYASTSFLYDRISDEYRGVVPRADESVFDESFNQYVGELGLDPEKATAEQIYDAATRDRVSGIMDTAGSTMGVRLSIPDAEDVIQQMRDDPSLPVEDAIIALVSRRPITDTPVKSAFEEPPLRGLEDAEDMAFFERELLELEGMEADDPSMVIFLEDGSKMLISDMMQEVRANQSLARALEVCAI